MAGFVDQGLTQTALNHSQHSVWTGGEKENTAEPKHELRVVLGIINFLLRDPYFSPILPRCFIPFACIRRRSDRGCMDRKL